MSVIHLRELSLTDVDQLNVWRNERDILDNLGANFRYIAKDVDINWYQHYLNNRDKSIRLAIIHSETNSYIGNVNLTDIQPINHSAEFSILIGNVTYRSQGIGTAATKLMIKYAFEDLNLHRIYLTVLQENIPAVKLYKKNGFKEDGILRESVFKNGKYCNMLAMSLLRHEYVELSAND